MITPHIGKTQSTAKFLEKVIPIDTLVSHGVGDFYHDEDGHIYISSRNGTSYLTKIDTAGNVIWHNPYEQLGIIRKVLVDRFADELVVNAGTSLHRIDKNGNYLFEYVFNTGRIWVASNDRKDYYIESLEDYDYYSFLLYSGVAQTNLFDTIFTLDDLYFGESHIKFKQGSFRSNSNYFHIVLEWIDDCIFPSRAYHIDWQGNPLKEFEDAGSDCGGFDYLRFVELGEEHNATFTRFDSESPFGGESGFLECGLGARSERYGDYEFVQLNSNVFLVNGVLFDCLNIDTIGRVHSNTMYEDFYPRYKHGINLENVAYTFTQDTLRILRIYYPDIDNDGFPSDVDCDDNDSSINPTALEICGDGIDQNCDGFDVEQTFYEDLDNDGFGSSEILACNIPSGYSLVGGDCDDNNPNIHPGHLEIHYNGVNDDCDSLSLDDDLDQDGFLLIDDCDDLNPEINPNQPELIYNGIDDDCDSLSLDDDLDQDGFLLLDDCDDTNSEINPSQDEIPYNGVDEDCNIQTLDDDLDQDGYLILDDCDDSNPFINPGLMEIPYNGLNDDCDSLTLDDDLDQDGFILELDCDDTNSEINPNALEIPNIGIDEDCDGDDLVTSISDLSNFMIKIYPNPTSEFLKIELNKSLDIRISLYDVT